MLEVLYKKHFPESTTILDDKIVESRNYIYCPECKKANTYEKAQFKDPIECLEYTAIPFTCCRCGKTYYIISQRRNNDNEHKLIRKRNTKKCQPVVSSISFANPSGVKTTEMICHDAENGKLFIVVRFLNFIPTPNCLIVESYYNKYIFNYKNHTSHLVSQRNFNGKKAFGSTTQMIINQTNAKDGLECGRVELWCISQETLMLFAQKYCELAGFESVFQDIVNLSQIQSGKINTYCSTQDNLFKSCLYSSLVTLNRFPNLIVNYDSYARKHNCILDFETPFMDKKFESLVSKTMSDRNEWIKATATKLKLPISKSFWTMYLANACNMDKVYYLMRCGFKNPDIIKNILSNESEIFPKPEHASYYEVMRCKAMYNSLRLVIKRMVKASGEHAASVKIIHSNRRSHIEDMVRMHDEVRRYDRLLLDTIDWTGSFREIHDELSLLSSKIAYANVAIPYSAKEKELEREVGNCQFKLALDTNELVAIGQTMKICVGSYRDYALSKRSTIVAMKKDGQYVGCIEIGSQNTLIQMKASRNRYLVGDIGEAAKRWVKEVGLNYLHCPDYKNIGIQIDSNADFHDLEIDEEGNVFNRREMARAQNFNDAFFDDDEWLPF